MPANVETLDALLQDVAKAYEALAHTPYQTQTARCYSQLTQQLCAQFEVLRAFVGIHWSEADPYTGSDAMFKHIDRRRWFSVYTGANLPVDHPFAVLTHYDGQIMNSVFRAVHDGIAHYPGRYPFGKVGEFRAFKAHCRLLTSNAQWALATETLGQNAYYHFGPAPGTYAPQKAGLLPPALVIRALELEI